MISKEQKCQIIAEIRKAYDKRAFEFFKEKKFQSLTNTGKWHALIYCILAGTQVPVEIARKAYEAIIAYKDDEGAIADMKRLAKQSKDDLDKLEAIVRGVGYRYPRQKSNCIMQAATYFQMEYGGDINLFLESAKDGRVLRDKLKNRVKGIGIKIATHWLRNIGYELGTIDIHVRRLLEWTKLADIDFWPKSMSERLFRTLEKEIEELASIANVDLNVLQYELWLFGRNYCSKNRCKECPAANVCPKGLRVSDQERERD